MKKKILLLLIMLLLPFAVNAKTCDENKIKIESIKLESIEGNTEEKSEPLITGRKINLNLKMSKVGDTALYKVLVKNESEEDYLLDENSLIEETDYIVYSLETDENKVLKPNEEKTIYLRVNYNKKVANSDFNNGVYQDNKNLQVNLSNNNDTVENNPYTNRNIILVSSLLIIILLGSIILIKNKKTKYIILLLALLLPFTVKAICNIRLDVESNVTIVKTEQFKLKLFICRYTIADDTFDFEEGMTIKEWVNSSYIQKLIDKNIELANNSEVSGFERATDEEIAQSTRRDIFNLIVNNITHDENYVIQPDDSFIYENDVC